jgi:hypothetical protein
LSLPSLNVAASALTPIQSHARGGSEQSASQSEFGGIMRSLSEKDSRSKSVDSAESDSETPAIPFGQVSAMPTLTPPVDARAVSLLAPLTNPLSGFIASAPSEGDSPSLLDQTMSASRLGAMVSSGENNTATHLWSMLEAPAASASAYGGGKKSSPLLDGSGQGQAAPPSHAFSRAASEMRLHVSRSVSHFGFSSPSLMNASPTDAARAKGNNSSAPAAESGFDPFAALSPPPTASVEPGIAGGSIGAGGAGTTISLSGVSLPLIPDVVAEATASLEASQAPPALNPVAPAAPKTGPARELDIQLAPPEMGSLFIKLKLSGGKLSVVIEASKPSTLSAIERERETILNRINSADSQVSSLVLRPSDPTQSMSGEGKAYDAAAASGNNAQEQTDRRPQWSEAGSRKRDPGPENLDPSPGASYLVV